MAIHSIPTTPANIDIDGHLILAELPANWTGSSSDELHSIVSIHNHQESRYQVFEITVQKTQRTFENYLTSTRNKLEENQFQILNVDKSKQIFWIQTKPPHDKGYNLTKVIFFDQMIYSIIYVTANDSNSYEHEQQIATQLINATKIA